jgi:acyl-CoA dehydrogenase
MAELKQEARRRGLWNLFLPDGERGAGLTVLDYAPIAELSGRSAALAPEAMNCSAPDTGNMELLAMFATEEQAAQWLDPLLAGEIRSCFSMTEPDVASSDATNIALTITPDGDSYVVNGRKWWSTGALRPECKVAIVMGVSDPDAGRYQRHSMILVPLDTPGVRIERSTTVYGYDDGPHGGHGVIHYDNVRVPESNLLGPQGGGFMMAQARLGPGRIHHCMRSLGMAERALELMCARAASRSTFGRAIAEHGVVQEWIAESRLAIEQARLLVLKTAWLIDTVGVRGARTEIAAIKVAAPRAASYVLDRAVQVFGAAGVSSDTPLAEGWAQLRTLHLADGPDEVHLRSVAREELKRHGRRT